MFRRKTISAVPVRYVRQADEAEFASLESSRLINLIDDMLGLLLDASGKDQNIQAAISKLNAYAQSEGKDGQLRSICTKLLEVTNLYFSLTTKEKPKMNAVVKRQILNKLQEIEQGLTPSKATRHVVAI